VLARSNLASAAGVTNGQRDNIVELLGPAAEEYARILPDREAGESKEELHRARFAACEGFIADGTFDDWFSEEHIMGLLALRGNMDGGPPSLHTHTHTAAPTMITAAPTMIPLTMCVV
jgi:hypothetical protein